MLRISLAAMALALGLGATETLAESSVLRAIIGGEAYDGPPRFEVSFGGTVLGEAAVEAAIDTAAVGRFADADNKRKYIGNFEFEIPESAFRPDAEVRIRLVNEAYGGDGSNRDRNLYVAAISVNDQAVTVSGLVTEGKDGVRPNELVGEFLLLADGNVEAVLAAPEGGWAAPAAMMAAAPQSVEKPPVEVMQVKAPASVEPAATASIDQDPEATACTRDEIYNVLGFNENSNELTPRLEARLDQIIEDIGAEKCTVLVTGYSSTQGAYATNALFAIERAQNVLAYLRRKGLQFNKVSATGAGETSQFGDDFAANRRVVITVMP